MQILPVIFIVIVCYGHIISILCSICLETSKMKFHFIFLLFLIVLVWTSPALAKSTVWPAPRSIKYQENEFIIRPDEFSFQVTGMFALKIQKIFNLFFFSFSLFNNIICVFLKFSSLFLTMWICLTLYPILWELFNLFYCSPLPRPPPSHCHLLQPR